MSDLADLRRRLAAIEAHLDGLLDAHRDETEGANDGADVAAARDAIKGDIVLLFRETDAALREYVALKESVKALAAKWKTIPAPSGAAPDTPPERAEPPAETPPVGHATLRVDHLGASTYVAKGWTAIAAGDYALAEEALRRALEHAPDDVEAAALHAWAVAAQHRPDDALALLAPIVARAPGSALARVSIGYAHLERAAYGEAIEQLAKATRADSDRKAALYANYYLGVVYLRREMYDDAVAFFRRAIALGPNLLEAYHEMGRAHWLGGERAAASDAWRAGAAASKFNAWAKRCQALAVIAEQGGDPCAEPSPATPAMTAAHPSTHV